MRVMIPLLLIGAAALWILSYQHIATGYLRVTSSVRGAEIYVAGVQTGYATDTTLAEIPVGRQIVTVRKQGYVSDPEVLIVELKEGEIAQAAFSLKVEKEIKKTDSIPPLRAVRQEVFSTGVPMRSIPPTLGRQERMLDVLAKRPESARDYIQIRDHSATDTTAIEPQRLAEDAPHEKSESVVYSLIETEIIVSCSQEGGEILVNGKATPRAAPYTFRGLDRGVYVFSLVRPGFIAKPESILVSLTRDYQHELVAFELTADKSLPQPTLTVNTTPPAAGVRVDGKPVGVGKIAVELGYGSHQVEFAEVPGYVSPVPITVELSTDHPQVEITGEYRRLEGNAVLAVFSADEGKNINGKKLRVFIDNELVLDYPQESFDAVLLKKIAAGNRLIRIQFDDLSEDVTLNLVDGEVKEIAFRVESFFSKRKLRIRERSSMTEEQWQKKSRRLTVLNAS
jgi:hypothetical protein